MNAVADASRPANTMHFIFREGGSVCSCGCGVRFCEYGDRGGWRQEEARKRQRTIACHPLFDRQHFWQHGADQKREADLLVILCGLHWCPFVL